MTTLAAECGDVGWRDNILMIRVAGELNARTGVVQWALRVERPTETKSGRAGKPVQLVTLVDEPTASVPDLLRILADIWELELP